jgi:hypothetical protein
MYRSLYLALALWFSLPCITLFGLSIHSLDGQILVIDKNLALTSSVITDVIERFGDAEAVYLPYSAKIISSLFSLLSKTANLTVQDISFSEMKELIHNSFSVSATAQDLEALRNLVDYLNLPQFLQPILGLWVGALMASLPAHQQTYLAHFSAGNFICSAKPQFIPMPTYTGPAIQSDHVLVGNIVYFTVSESNTLVSFDTSTNTAILTKLSDLPLKLTVGAELYLATGNEKKINYFHLESLKQLGSITYDGEIEQMLAVGHKLIFITHEYEHEHEHEQEHGMSIHLFDTTTGLVKTLMRSFENIFSQLQILDQSSVIFVKAEKNKYFLSDHVTINKLDLNSNVITHQFIVVNHANWFQLATYQEKVFLFSDDSIKILDNDLVFERILKYEAKNMGICLDKYPSTVYLVAGKLIFIDKSDNFYKIDLETGIKEIIYGHQGSCIIGSCGNYLVYLDLHDPYFRPGYDSKLIIINIHTGKKIDEIACKYTSNIFMFNSKIYIYENDGTMSYLEMYFLF